MPNISHGSVATRLKYGRILDRESCIRRITNLLLSRAVKEF